MQGTLGTDSLYYILVIAVIDHIKVVVTIPPVCSGIPRFKLDAVAPLMADPPPPNLTTMISRLVCQDRNL